MLRHLFMLILLISSSALAAEEGEESFPAPEELIDALGRPRSDPKVGALFSKLGKTFIEDEKQARFDAFLIEFGERDFIKNEAGTFIDLPKGKKRRVLTFIMIESYYKGPTPFDVGPRESIAEYAERHPEARRGDVEHDFYWELPLWKGNVYVKDGRGFAGAYIYLRPTEDLKEGLRLEERARKQARSSSSTVAVALPESSAHEPAGADENKAGRLSPEEVRAFARERLYGYRDLGGLIARCSFGICENGPGERVLDDGMKVNGTFVSGNLDRKNVVITYPAGGNVTRYEGSVDERLFPHGAGAMRMDSAGLTLFADYTHGVAKGRARLVYDSGLMTEAALDKDGLVEGDAVTVVDPKLLPEGAPRVEVRGLFKKGVPVGEHALALCEGCEPVFKVRETKAGGEVGKKMYGADGAMAAAVAELKQSGSYLAQGEKAVRAELEKAKVPVRATGRGWCARECKATVRAPATWPGEVRVYLVSTRPNVDFRVDVPGVGSDRCKVGANGVCALSLKGTGSSVTPVVVVEATGTPRPFPFSVLYAGVDPPPTFSAAPPGTPSLVADARLELMKRHQFHNFKKEGTITLKPRSWQWLPKGAAYISGYAVVDVSGRLSRLCYRTGSSDITDLIGTAPVKKSEGLCQSGRSVQGGKVFYWPQAYGPDTSVELYADEGATLHYLLW